MKRSTLDQLDALIQEEGDTGAPKDGEFTIRDYLRRVNEANGTDMALVTATHRLNQLVQQGKLLKRKGTLNNRQINVYRRP